jgi:flagellin
MSLTLGGSGSSSLRSISFLKQAKSKMDKSLERISSGRKILSGADDPGGLAVAMKLQSQISNTDVARDRVENAKSFVDMQDAALETAGDILTEMMELRSNWKNETDKTSSTAVSYATQFREYQVQLGQLKNEKFNGVSLFSTEPRENMTVSTSTGGSAISLGTLDIGGGLSIPNTTINFGDNTTDAGSVDNSTLGVVLAAGDIVSIGQEGQNIDASLDTALDQISGLRAQAGGKSSALGFASDYLSNMSTNLEAAHGRIMDVDIAEETAKYAAHSMQYEAAAAAVAQANLAMGVVLDLLISSINRD